MNSHSARRTWTWGPPKTRRRTARALVVIFLAAVPLGVAIASPALAFDQKYRAHQCTYGGTLKATSWLVTPSIRRYHVSATSTSSWPLNYTRFDNTNHGKTREYYVDAYDHGAWVLGDWYGRSCVINGA